MNRHSRLESILLTVTLLAVSGGILSYNILTAEGGDISVSLSDLIGANSEGDGDAIGTGGEAISAFAAGVILASDTGEVIPVMAGAAPVPPEELLPPIVRPDP